MKKSIAVILALMLTVSGLFVGCGSTDKSEPATDETGKLKIALILPGKKDDVSFNQAMYDGMRAVEAEYKDQIEVTYLEECYEIADIEPALIDFASEGYNLIIGHGFQFMEPMIKVAAQYPDVMFMNGTGFKTANNVGFYDSHLDAGGYLMGVIAAMKSETGKIGVVGGQDVAEVHRGHEGYKLGAKSVNPDIIIEEVFTGDWRDTAAAKEAAIGMYDDGVDVIWHSGDGIGLGVVQAAKEKGAYCLGNVADQSALAPESILTGVLYDWKVIIKQMVDDALAGNIIGRGDVNYWCTIQNGGVDLCSFMEGAFTDEQKSTILDIKAKLASGEIVLPDLSLKTE